MPKAAVTRKRAAGSSNKHILVVTERSRLAPTVAFLDEKYKITLVKINGKTDERDHRERKPACNRRWNLAHLPSCKNTVQ